MLLGNYGNREEDIKGEDFTRDNVKEGWDGASQIPYGTLLSSDPEFGLEKLNLDNQETNKIVYLKSFLNTLSALSHHFLNTFSTLFQHFFNTFQQFFFSFSSVFQQFFNTFSTLFQHFFNTLSTIHLQFIYNFSIVS